MFIKKESIEFFRSLFVAIFLALLVRSFLAEPFHIPSGSMIPTLEVGDHLFVSKYSYGYSRYSFPLSPNLFSGRFFASNPRRGDVIVFRKPGQNTKMDFIKRLIGLPGDTIAMKDGRLWLNGKKVQKDYVGEYVLAHIERLWEGETLSTPTNQLVRLQGDEIFLNGKKLEDNYTIDYRSSAQCSASPSSCQVVVLQKYLETLPNGKSYNVVEVIDHGPLDNTPVYRVPEGHYFMMGDNRDMSEDSRVSSVVGFVPRENLIGRAEFIFYSHNHYRNFIQVWVWPKLVRTERFFRSI